MSQEEAGAATSPPDDAVARPPERRGKENLEPPALLQHNDENATVSFGKENADTIYCGRRLGEEAIPESDGRCGPSKGPQCPSCKRFQSGPRRVDVLMAAFPAFEVTERSAIVAALRVRGGILEDAAAYLREMGATSVVPFSAALPDLPENDAPEPVDEDRARQLAETLGLNDVTVAEAALRRHGGDVERSAAWVLDEPDAVEVAAIEYKEAAERAAREVEEAEAARDRALKTAAEVEVPDEVKELGESCGAFVRLEAEAEAAAVASGEGGGGETATEARDVVFTKGHRMVRVKSAEGDGAEEAFCAVCADMVPSPLTGSYRCRECHLCEGCVQSTAVLRCPRLANGGHLHCHPLKYGLDRRASCVCDVNGEGCLIRGSVVWTCRECDFDACAVCMARPPPAGYTRTTRGFEGAQDDGDSDNEDEDEEETEEESDEEDSDDDESSAEPPLGSRPFDEVAAERGAAARWEGAYEPPVEGAEVVVGTGAIGTTAPYLSPGLLRRGRASQEQKRGRLQGESTLLADTRLSDEAARALELYSSSQRRGLSGDRGRQSSDSSSQRSIVAAADVTHVEDILHRANAVDDRLTSRALCEAIAAGRLEIAGTLLLSQAYAPMPPGGSEEKEEKDDDEAAPPSDEEAELKCWCGVVIDVKMSPDGAVGCLGGHAMHASCAADLLLGGGTCPTCRQPLFFGRVPDPEAKSAKELVIAELQQSKEEQEERVRREIDELAAQGLELALNVGDVVRISDDKEACEKGQMEDPRAGGWDDDMVDACGKEGRVAKAIEDDGKTVAIKVVTKGLKHDLVRIRHRENYKCEKCDMWGPSDETGRKRCSHCALCQTCCQNTSDGTCPKTVHDWAWNPSLLTLVCRADAVILWDSDLADEEEVAAKAADQHMVRLRAELKAVSAAREAIKDNKEYDLLKPTLAGRELTANSRAAVNDLLDSVSPADWRRARHLLLLARQWGDSEEAKSKRATLYSAVRNGEIDSVARIVRRYNAARTAEAAVWTDALTETSEYIVEPTAKVDLRAFPSASAPKTGYSLGPDSRFFSNREILDYTDNMWLQIADTSLEEFEGKRVVADKTNTMTSHTLVGARVRRGKDWKWDDQDGGEGKEGVIIEVVGSDVVSVRWDANAENEYNYRAGKNDKYDLVFAGAPPPPPQGWLCVRPGGLGSPAVVTRARSALRCFSCGDGLIPPKVGREKYSMVKGTDVQKGDRLFVAATLEPVLVQSSKGSRIFCSFPTKNVTNCGISKEVSEKVLRVSSDGVDKVDVVSAAKDQSSAKPPSDSHKAKLLVTDKHLEDDQGGLDIGNQKRSNLGNKDSRVETGVDTIWYRPDDLVFTKGKGDFLEEDDETLLVEGHIRTRREVVLMCGGKEAAAKKAWNKAKSERGRNKKGEDTEEERSFASCSRGHLLHARCLQGALLAGRRCPAPGCTEPLWVPRVIRERRGDDDDSCGGGDRAYIEAEAEALRTANELAGHAALVAARASEGGGLRADEEINSAGIRDLKMCPACCSGPLFNENCSDMQTHHGECSAVAIRGQSDTEGECTDEGVFRATASDIAARMMRIKATETVADVLPKCPTHKVLVMFNGCMACGHLFTDTDWDEMPKWDPTAKAVLELDKKKRKAADLLAKQIRTEAAMLQFERDALLDKWDDGLKHSVTKSDGADRKTGDGSNVFSSLPSPPPPLDKYRVRGCGPSCSRRHENDGDCLVCGRGWGVHYDHSCPGGRGRGSWPLR